MLRMGSPNDKASMGSLLETLKYEEICLCEYETLDYVMSKLHYFIGQVYNLTMFHGCRAWEVRKGTRISKMS